MATEILLMADVEDLGVEGDVVTVADGFARNFLFPKKLGAKVTPATQRQLVKLREKREVRRKAEREEANRKAEKLSGVSCTIPVKTAEDKMYGSVTVADILAALKLQGIELDKHSVKIDKPIKELGVYDITVSLDKEVETTIKVWVVEE